MSSKRRSHGADDARERLHPELGYFWEDPPSSQPADPAGFWQGSSPDPVENMVEELVEMEWPVADIRHHIELLGVQAKGRSRRDLAQQLAESFLDPERLARAVAELSKEERRYYTHLLLQIALAGLYVSPDSAGLQQYLSIPQSRWTSRIINRGLALRSPQGEVSLPFGMMQYLPSLRLSFPTAAAPSDYEPAADARDILSQVQQILGLLQVEPGALRDRPRWKAPKYLYAAPPVCWPPFPEDARQIVANQERQIKMMLWPPEPHLDQASLDTWCDVLDVPVSRVEFLYHVMVATGILWTGNPLVVDAELTQTWMALPPGRQIAALYRLSRNIMRWSSWWSAWREGRARVKWSYYGYWSLNSLDETLYVTHANLRWVLLEILSFLPSDVWLAMEDVVEMITALFPRPETHRYLMSLRPESQEAGWTGFLVIALQELLAGPLHALGLVDVAPSREEIALVRLKGDLQSLHWGRSQEVVIPVAGELQREAVRYMPEGAVLEIATPVPPDVTNCILKWAKPSGFSRNLVRYHLDVQRLHRAFEAGEDPDTLHQAWEACAGFDPMAEIVAWWQHWWSRYGHVRLYSPQAMIETRDAFTMHELQVSLPSLQSSLLGVVTPEAVLVESQDVDQILEDLERQGYMPKETP